MLLLKALKLFNLVRFGKTKQVIDMILSYQTSQLKLLAIILVMFSIIGMNLFGRKIYRDHYNTDNNFSDFLESFFLMVKLSTMEQINDFVYDLYSNDPYQTQECVKNQSWQSYEKNGPLECGSLSSYLFFQCFSLAVCYIIMNLTIGLFIDALNQDKDGDDFIVKFKDVDRFKQLWAEYDTKLRGYVSAQQLAFLVTELPDSLVRHSVETTDYSTKEFEELYQQKLDENELL